LQIVILSGVAASQREAATQSKDLYLLFSPRTLTEHCLTHAVAKMPGVLLLHPPIRKRTGGLRLIG